MYDLLTLNVQCPLCQETLMDKEHLVDHEPSIRLTIGSGNLKGTIWLSSVYGSYSVLSTIGKPPAGEITTFYCPHCDGEINSDELCSTCEAPMVPFNLDIGGRVSICSRSGCLNHAVEFEDLNDALRRLYQHYGIHGQQAVQEDKEIKIVPEAGQPKGRELIGSGSFIHGYCPKCRKSLVENDLIKLSIRNNLDEKGFVMLSPYLNVYSTRSTVFLPEEQIIQDVGCPHCSQTLISSRMTCGKCNSPVAMIAVSARTRLIDFYLCTRKGCRWHGLSQDDYQDIALEDSLEW